MYQKFTIGRNPDNNIVVPNPSVSGYHADLIYNDSMGYPQYTYVDHSTNGTLINGQWIRNSSCIVGINDTIILAGCVTFDWSVFNMYGPTRYQTYANPAYQAAGTGNNPGMGNPYAQNSPARDEQEISFTGALKSFFYKYVDFKGRATRREFWFVYLWMLIFSSFLSVIISILSFSSISALFLAFLDLDGFDIANIFSLFANLGWFIGIYCIFDLATIIPRLSLLVRRIHDTGKDGLWILMLLVPIANIVFFFIWTLTPSEPRPNKWGY